MQEYVGGIDIRSKTRFDTEAKDNSQMAYCVPYFESAGHEMSEIEPESK